MVTKQRPTPPPNPTHRRQILWQIWLPLVLIFVLFLGLAALAVSLTAQGSGVASQWAALSVIVVILPSCLGGFFSLIFVGIGIFLSTRMIKGLPGIAYQVQLFFRRITAFIRFYANRLVSPVININSHWAGLSAIFKSKNK